MYFLNEFTVTAKNPKLALDEVHSLNKKLKLGLEISGSPEDIFVISLDGGITTFDGKPSEEFTTYAEVYNNIGVGQSYIKELAAGSYEFAAFYHD